MLESIDLLRSNMIRDRRRRYLYLKSNKKEGYQIMEFELKFMHYYTSRHLFGTMIFLVPFGIFKINTFISVALTLAFVLGLEIYFRFFFLKNRPVLDLTEKELKLIESLEALDIMRSEALSRALMSLLMVFIMFSNLAQGGRSEAELRFISFLMVLFIFYSASRWGIWFRYKRQIWRRKNEFSEKKEDE